jgi:hypothetical protein
MASISPKMPAYPSQAVHGHRCPVDLDKAEQGLAEISPFIMTNLLKSSSVNTTTTLLSHHKPKSKIYPPARNVTLSSCLRTFKTSFMAGALME